MSSVDISRKNEQIKKEKRAGRNVNVLLFRAIKAD